MTNIANGRNPLNAVQTYLAAGLAGKRAHQALTQRVLAGALDPEAAEEDARRILGMLTEVQEEAEAHFWEAAS